MQLRLFSRHCPKVLESPHDNCGKGVNCGVVREERQFLSGASELAPEEMVELCWIGIPSEPRDFVTRAIAAGHPRSLDVHVDETMQKVVKLNLIDPPFVLAKKRVEYLKKWTARAKETVAQEEELRELHA